jgi:phosphoribosylformimino-5-aminoimidazole carboxamide ribotide isomerase
MNLFPSIDLRDGRVVRLLQGDYDRQTTYEVDAVEQAKMYADAGATWAHVVDLDGARSGKMANLALVEAVCAEGRLKVEVGGGVRDTATVERVLGAGARRVVVGTAALADWDWFEALVKSPACHERIVLGLDARGGKLAVSGWERQTQSDALEVARRVRGWPLGAIVYTDIAVDGTMDGPNLEATRRIAEATDVPVVASGGVSALDHLLQLRQLPIAGAIVGRALYEHAFTVEEAIEAFERSVKNNP